MIQFFCVCACRPLRLSLLISLLGFLPSFFFFVCVCVYINILESGCVGARAGGVVGACGRKHTLCSVDNNTVVEHCKRRTIHIFPPPMVFLCKSIRKGSMLRPSYFRAARPISSVWFSRNIVIVLQYDEQGNGVHA